MTPPLVSAVWLRDHLEDSELILLDASSIFDPSNGIKGALHFDIKNVFSDSDSPFPNTFPPTQQFEKEYQQLGIDRDSHLIVFDNKGIFTSPRVWWMFKTMGHEKISVLDGGIPHWHSLGFPTGALPAINTHKGTFKATLNQEALSSYEQITENINTQSCQLVDARSQGRFEGTAPEPRAHIKSGHIPHAINLPYTAVLDGNRFKSKEALEAIFQDRKFSKKPLIFSCGSGITACILLLAYYLVSGNMSSVYDGSWTEWAEKNERTL